MKKPITPDQLADLRALQEQIDGELRDRYVKRWKETMVENETEGEIGIDGVGGVWNDVMVNYKRVNLIAMKDGTVRWEYA